MSSDETVYWRTQAQLLDPRSFHFYAHTSTSVPWGETWQAVNLWRVRSKGEPAIYQREADVRQAITLPSGTTLDAPDGFAYVSEPITDDPRYASGESAKALYYERLRRLRSLPIRVLSIDTTGRPMGVTISAPFPADVRRALIVEASAMDVAWVALQGPPEGVNLFNEISDDHELRNAHGLLLPFDTATFPGIFTRPASVSGKPDEAMPGSATILYVALPEDW
jgi:hypothetical protein